ncbi:DNA repair protein [Citromicrobium sp. RCC1885]|uniref:non-homologous end joining protein Ku n=1 Tax=unclassified Citromicrobium TaxID=2630544 RepID=UPI0006C8EBA2|nr:MULTISPECIES: Ku protein [unclassified Citromicrobium]KPM21652.1 DNA repair protein [Citromicrobium sp. RCC1885]KPM23422.1 DNA repair protein [Citromicrobium sp. RCC1878]OAM07041.1 Ku protein [Citromicrobium sp. RCC1897]|tara:strand:+ start:3857 stop:4690 length:834 start_codon:yes stop_codon:yes gene_type:complete
MAARAYWQGQIRLALVSIPVEIYSASQSGAKISFRQIHEPSGKRISYEKVVEGVGPVDRDDIIRGYELSKNNYVLLEDEEIEAVKVESKKTLELVQFVDQSEIDPLYFEKPYYVVPKDDLAEEAFIVLREALRKAKKTALGQLSVRGQEKLVAIKPCGKGMLLETLRYADEVREGQKFFGSIGDDKPEEELLDLASTLIEKKTAPFDASEFEDRYAEALHKLIDKKAKAKGNKKVIEDVEEPSGDGGNVIDLMAALKKSVDGDKPAKSSAKKKKKSA